MINERMVRELFEKLQAKKAFVVFAESLTGGLISSELSKIEGASGVLWGSYVTYNTFAKERVLGVPSAVIDKDGVVSSSCAYHMASGALEKSFAINGDYPTYSLAVTGMAGPSSSSADVEVGTVYIATAKLQNYRLDGMFPSLAVHCKTKHFHFRGDRQSVREQTLNNGIEMLLDLIDEYKEDRAGGI